MNLTGQPSINTDQKNSRYSMACSHTSKPEKKLKNPFEPKSIKITSDDKAAKDAKIEY